jgi:glycosyltransferase involved in cell wall biosynthesis
MTRVLVDGRSLGGDGAFRGFGRYLGGVLGGLAGVEDLTITVLVTEPTLLPDGIEPVPVRRRLSGRLAPFEHSLLLPRDIRAVPGDVFHSAGHDPPRRCHRPWVQTLYDVIPLVLDDPAYRGARRQWRARARRMRRASAFIAVSHHTAAEAVRVLELDPGRVHVAHLGVDAVFRTPDHRHHPDPPYLLFVAELGPNKGHAEAFDVIAGLADAGHPHRLKVAGRIASWVAPQIERLRARARRPDRIDLVGYVPDSELVSLYRGATALLVTSRAEGFGLPALEAMATGTPVVAFDNTATSEVVDGGGELVEDGDVGAAVKALDGLILDPRRWEEASGRGTARAAQFTWDRCAQMHAEVFRLASGEA